MNHYNVHFEVLGKQMSSVIIADNPIIAKKKAINFFIIDQVRFVDVQEKIFDTNDHAERMYAAWCLNI